MLKRGGGPREDEAEAEAEVHGTQEWKDLGEIRKGDKRWFITLEEDEETMEEEADEERTRVGIGGRGRSVRSFFCFDICHQEGREDVVRGSGLE